MTKFQKIALFTTIVAIASFAAFFMKTTDRPATVHRPSQSIRVTTTVMATLSAGHTFVLSGHDTNGFTCPAQPIVIDGSTTPTTVPGAACTVGANNTSLTCTGVPTGIPWTIRVCHAVGGTTYVNHTAVIFGGNCIAGTAGYHDFSSIVASNGSSIEGTTSSGICRNRAL